MSTRAPLAIWALLRPALTLGVLFVPAAASITKSPNHQIAKSEIDNRQSTMMRDVSYRVVADHLRCLTFAITDGAMPSNEGRGYVLRRILRRAVRYGRQYLNMHEPFLCDLVEPLVAHMSEAFPELKTGPDRRHPRNNVQYVADILREEEASFLKTLDRGIRLFNEAADYARTHHHGRIGGEAAFKLHDTYGFPIDLTEQMAEEQGLTVDIGEYERLMDEARRRARSASTVFSEQLIEDLDLIPETRFVGYERTSESNTVVQAIVRNGELVDELGPNQEAELCLTCTPFYAEQGGQVGDKGVIQGRNRDWSFEVIKTRKIGDWYLHFGRCTRGRIVAFQPTSPGYVWSETPAPFTDEEMHLILEGNQVAAAVAEVAQEFRRPTMQNHTSTHLLNWALRDVLGPHVDQKGSLVDPEKTRFDFSHPKAVAAEELDRIESLVNEKIRADLPVFTQEVDQKRARQVKTLRAVFGEKYPERVRVVSIGARIGEEDNPAPDTLLGSPDDPKWMQYSVEFCGGTHLKRTGEAEHFVLTHEEAVAKGIRRVVGISGEAAHRAESDGEELLAEVEALCGRAGSARHRRDRECHQTPTETAGEARPTSKPSRDPNPSRNPNPSRDREGADASEATKPRPRDATMVADFQVRLAAAVIPIRVRRRINERLAELQKEIKEQEKEVAAASADQLMDRVRELLKIAETRGGVTIVIGQVPPAPPEAFRLAVDFVRQKAGSSAVLLATVSEGNVTLLAGMSKDLVERGIKAGDLIKEICPIVGGKGGGRPDMAQGGGTEVAGIGRAVAQALEWLRNRISQ
jgi:alanyl-tRNA synthetase